MTRTGADRLTVSNGVDELENHLGLVLGRDEPPLGLERVAEAFHARLTCVKLTLCASR